MADAPKKRRTTRRGPKTPEPILTVLDFMLYPGLLNWLHNQAHKHANSAAGEIIYRLKLAFELDQRRGEKGKLAGKTE